MTGSCSSSDKKVEVIEIDKKSIVLFDEGFNKIGELEIANDVLVVSMPNNFRKITLFNSQKDEITLEFKTENEKDLFMLFLEFKKSKLAVESKRWETPQTNPMDSKLFENLEAIESKKKPNLLGTQFETHDQIGRAHV